MSKYSINDTTLTGIANAIRAKDGTANPIAVSDFATRISAIQTGGSSGGINPITVSQDMRYFDYNGLWDDVIENNSNLITTSNIQYIDFAFFNSSLSDLSSISLNFRSAGLYFTAVFKNCINLTTLPTINTLKLTNGASNDIFYGCQKLRSIPQNWISNVDFSSLHTTTSNLCECFYNCHSLRTVPSIWLSDFYSKANGTSSHYNREFYYCLALDEIVGLNVGDETFNNQNNRFNSTFDYCSRLNRMTFLTDNGTPYQRAWRGQTIDLSNYVGYSKYESSITDYNSGITSVKQVTDATSYEALKNDPDWFTTDEAYSRFNRISAEETIASLPDCSSGTAANTIKFKRNAGSATDGGAIVNMEANIISAAAAKNWTVTYVA